MQTKLVVQLSDTAGAAVGCIDADRPVKYRLLSFATESACRSSSKGQPLSSSSWSSFSSISVASGVKCLGIEAADSLGASVRLCSRAFDVANATADTLARSFLSAYSSLAGDSEG